MSISVDIYHYKWKNTSNNQLQVVHSFSFSTSTPPAMYLQQTYPKYIQTTQMRCHEVRTCSSTRVTTRYPPRFTACSDTALAEASTAMSTPHIRPAVMDSLFQLPFELSFLQPVLRNDFSLPHAELQSHVNRWGHEDAQRQDKKLARLNWTYTLCQRVKTVLSKAEIHLLLQSHLSKECLLLHK